MVLFEWGKCPATGQPFSENIRPLPQGPGPWKVSHLIWARPVGRAGFHHLHW